MSKVSLERKVEILVLEDYTFSRTTRTAIKATRTDNGDDMHVGLYFVNKLRKEINLKLDNNISNELLYKIIIKNTPRKHGKTDI